MDGSGLSRGEVLDRVERGQTNDFRPPTSRTVSSILRANLLTLFNGVILVCFVALLTIDQWQDALFGASALANTVIGIVQELRAKRVLDRLSVLHPVEVVALRDGMPVAIPITQVVVDDVLLLRAGDQVPADATIDSATGFQVDESMLTGESDPVDKPDGSALLSGSIVLSGTARARATRVGGGSYANVIADRARQFSLVDSELRRSVSRVLGWIAWLLLPIAALVLNAQVIAEGGWTPALSPAQWHSATVGTIAAVVAMIPLGLVLMTSIAFAVGAARLGLRGVLVHELAAVELLARVDVICFDKTGTLTDGVIAFEAAHAVEEQALAAAENSAAASGTAPTGWERVLGWYGADEESNATARSLSSAFPATAALLPIRRVPFSSARKWSAVEFADGAPGSWVLGGADVLFPAADDALHRRAAELSATGRRTLVLAHSVHPLAAPSGEGVALPAELGPAVVLTFTETIRPDAAETLEYFRREGVAVRILSGDSAATVAAVARAAGMAVEAAHDARDLPDEPRALRDALASRLVLGRVTPAQKIAIVAALRDAGHVVAMVGDGVNDALAIKRADLGIAMGSGAPATKAVARMTLLDGRFRALPGIVAEGRRVAANIELVSMLFLTKTVYAVALAVAIGAATLPFPFLPRQLSVTDGLTIGIPAFFLALLPNARRYRAGFLGRALRFAVPAGATIGVTLFAYTRAASALGVPERELRSGATILLALVALWVLTALARPLTRTTAAIILATVAGLGLVLFVPLASDFLELAPLGGVTATLVAVATALAIVTLELLGLRRPRPSSPLSPRWRRDPVREAPRTRAGARRGPRRPAA
nr:HAD-IC family P-type ATPase [Galbitalea soli]